jgi:glycosyltransferase involved in cell wall biosynthesis
MRTRLLRITTVPESLLILLNGQLEFMQQHGFDVLAVSSRGAYVHEIRKNGIPHQSVFLTRRISPFADLVALFQIILLIIKFKPEIVHTHTPKAGLLGMMAAWICRVPVRLHTVAGLPLMETSGIKRQVLKLTERITYACAHRIYPNSKGLAEFIKRHFKSVNPKKICILGEGSSNGIDTKHYAKTPYLETEAKRIRAKLGIDADGKVFGFVGRIVRDKGIKELIAAFKQINNHNNVYLLLVGAMEADLDPINKSDLEFIHAAGNVFMVGHQHDVRPWMLAMDVFVFPSYREGFPNVVMQAACLELPCIVSDINGCNEIIEHNKTGVVVPVKNGRALAGRMKELLDNPEQRKQFGKHAREFIVQHFEQQLFWERLLKEYRTLLMNKP